MENQGKENLFDKMGCEVKFGDVEIGNTKILDDSPGHVVVEINFSIRANMSIPEIEKIELLKERAFEPGIFVSTVTSKDPKIEVDCSTVVFGKRQGFSA